MTHLSELMERVKAATGPDRELSRDIWQALDTPEWKTAYLRAQEPCGCPHDQAVEYSMRYLPDLTASIDAALALVERLLPGWRYDIHSPRFGTPFEGVLMEGDSASRRIVVAHAPTAPRAILAALLLSLSQDQK